MFLFVILTFLGVWIGYTYAPEKMIEIETVPNNVIDTETKASNEEDTLGWKIYRNEEYGFQFQYPSASWEIRETKSASGFSIIVFTNYVDYLGTQELFINLSNELYTDLTGFILEESSLVVEDEAGKKLYKSVYKWADLDYGERYVVFLDIDAGTEKYSFGRFSYSSGDQEKKNTYDRVLSSFRFIDDPDPST